MCGIIGNFNKNKPTNKEVINTYENQFSRGQEGFGIITINDNGQIKIHRATEPTKFMLDLYTNKSKGIIAHHRNPTSTRNLLKQTHPIKVENEILNSTYYMIHNGVIFNQDEMMEKHKKLGFKYTTETALEYRYKKCNDSESLAIELALFLEHKSEEIEAKGSCAFIMLEVDKKTNKAKNLYFGKNHGSPLQYKVTKNSVKISSEGDGETMGDEQLIKINLNKKIFKIEKKEIKFNKPETIKREPLPSSTIGLSRCGMYYPDNSDYPSYPGMIENDPLMQKDLSKENKEKTWFEKLKNINKTDYESLKEEIKQIKRDTMTNLELVISETFNEENLKKMSEENLIGFKDDVTIEEILNTEEVIEEIAEALSRFVTNTIQAYDAYREYNSTHKQIQPNEQKQLSIL